MIKRGTKRKVKRKKKVNYLNVIEYPFCDTVAKQDKLNNSSQ